MLREQTANDTHATSPACMNLPYLTQYDPIYTVTAADSTPIIWFALENNMKLSF